MIGLPPTSCSTLGCFDLSRVPLPAAMIAMATRGRCTAGLLGREDFDFALEGFAMLSQYTATESSSNRLPSRRLRHERHQIVRDMIGSVPRHGSLVQIISEHRTHTEGFDRFDISWIR